MQDKSDVNQKPTDADFKLTLICKCKLSLHDEYNINEGLNMTGEFF